MTRGTGGARLEVPKEDESGAGDSLAKFGPVNSVRDDKREFGLRMCRGGRVIRTIEKMCDEPSAKSGEVLMTSKGGRGDDFGTWSVRSRVPRQRLQKCNR
jgi:hypothetical protein